MSHETIYQSLYVQSGRAARPAHGQPGSARAGGARAGAPRAARPVADMVPISSAAGSRPRVRDWEGDLLVGKGALFVATLVERHTAT